MNGELEVIRATMATLIASGMQQKLRPSEITRTILADSDVAAALANTRTTDDAPTSRRFAQPCDTHEYIEPDCPDCGKLVAVDAPTSDDVVEAAVARALAKDAGEHWFGSARYARENERWRKTARAAITALPKSEARTDATSDDAVEALVVNYIEGRGGHDSQCCHYHLGHGCNCRVAEWRLAFRAGFLAALPKSEARPDPIGGPPQ